MNFYLDLYIKTKNDLPFTQAQSKIAYKGGCLPSDSLKSLKLSTNHSEVELALIKEKLKSKIVDDTFRNPSEWFTVFSLRG